MEFRDAARELLAISRSTTDVARLRERVEYIKAALDQRVGTNKHRRDIVRAAVCDVLRYLALGKPPGHEREMLMRTLYRLESAGNFDNRT